MIVRSTFAVALIAITAWFTLSGESVDAERRHATVRAIAAPPAQDADLPIVFLNPDPDPDGVERSRQSRFRLTYQLDSQIEGEAGPSLGLTGEWTTERLSDGRVSAKLSRVNISDHAMAPTAEQAERALELIVADGVIEGIGFAPKTHNKARRLLSNLATTVWPVVREGDEWTVAQEDLGGAHEAVYARIDNRTIERRVERVTALRGPDGLHAHGADGIKTEGVATFEFDAHGLKTARIADDRTFSMQGQTLTVVARVRATLQRVDTQVVIQRAPVPFPAQTFQPEIDYAQQAALRADQKVAGADLKSLMGALDAALRMDPKHPDTKKWRHRALERLTALVRIDPAQAQEMGALLGRMQADDPRVPFVAGALSSANTVDGTNALAAALDADLPAKVRQSVHANLSLTQTPTTESMQALTTELDGDLGTSAAMALGAQAGQMEPEAEAAESAIEILLRRYREASDVPSKIAALKALGNSGHPAILATVTEAIASGHGQIAYHGVRALRFVPGPEVDALLAAQLQGAHRYAVIEAVSHRDRMLWAPRLAEARAGFAEDGRMVEAIDQLIAQWG